MLRVVGESPWSIRDMYNYYLDVRINITWVFFGSEDSDMCPVRAGWRGNSCVDG